MATYSATRSPAPFHSRLRQLQWARGLAGRFGWRVSLAGRYSMHRVICGWACGGDSSGVAVGVCVRMSIVAKECRDDALGTKRKRG